MTSIHDQDIKIEPLEVSIREEIGIIWDGASPVRELVEYCEQKRKSDLHKLTDQHVFNAGRCNKIFDAFLRRVYVRD